MTGHNDTLPVGILYDQDKIDENSNIEPILVVPVGTARTRSNNDHSIGRRLYEQATADLQEIKEGKYRGIPLELWKQKVPNYPVPTVKQLEAKLRTLKMESPDSKGKDAMNHIDTLVQGVLKLSAGIKGFRSNQSTQSLSARAGNGVHGEGGGPSFSGTGNHPGPTTNVQIAVSAGKELAKKAEHPIKKWVGLNGKH